MAHCERTASARAALKEHDDEDTMGQRCCRWSASASKARSMMARCHARIVVHMVEDMTVIKRQGTDAEGRQRCTKGRRSTAWKRQRQRTDL